jgi:hypothetical protein
MDIGEVIIYRRRRYRIRGLDPHGVVPQNVYLEDVDTGKQVTLTMQDLHRDMRLVERDPDDTRPEPLG